MDLDTNIHSPDNSPGDFNAVGKIASTQDLLMLRDIGVEILQQDAFRSLVGILLMSMDLLIFSSAISCSVYAGAVGVKNPEVGVPLCKHGRKWYFGTWLSQI